MLDFPVIVLIVLCYMVFEDLILDKQTHDTSRGATCFIVLVYSTVLYSILEGYVWLMY